jgi:predicted HicB family RNase H-like nuclease
MVSSFGKVGFRPTIKAGHEDGQDNPETAARVFGFPALGYVSRLYREGKTLLADVVDIPRRFADLIKAKAYRRVSAEIYWNYKDNGQTLPRVLKAIAFLGSEIPAIPTLKELEELYARDDGALRAYDDRGLEVRIYRSEVKKTEAEIEAEKQAKAKKTEEATMKEVKLSREDVRKICPSCAEKMEHNGLTSLTFKSEEALKAFAFATVEECMAAASMVKECPDEGTRKAKCEGMIGGGDGSGDGGYGKKMALIENELKAYKGGADMTKEELAQERENMKKELAAQFAADIAKAREDGEKAAEAKFSKRVEESENEIKKMQAERRSNDIDGWIEGQKKDGRIAAVETVDIKAFMLALDEGKTLTYSKEGKEVSASQMDAFKGLIAKRPSLFTTLSNAGSNGNGEQKAYANVGDEVDTKVRAYMAEKGVKEYRVARDYVLTADPDLKDRYTRGSN